MRTIGEFVLDEPLDEGGFGRVYRCKQPTLGREAVIKVLHRQMLSHDPQRRITKILEPEFAADGTFLRESLRSPDGELVSYTVYHYDRDGYLLELVTHAPGGTITSRQDA